jgi:hypothetical protein
VPAVKAGDVCVCLLPACCDLGGTTLSGIGLLFTSASVFQMLRGSLMVFTGPCLPHSPLPALCWGTPPPNPIPRAPRAGMFTVVFLKRSLARFKVVGIMITVVGITAVGLSSTIFPVPAAASGGSGNATTTLTAYGSGATPTPAPTAAGSGNSMVLFGNLLVIISQAPWRPSLYLGCMWEGLRGGWRWM